MGEREREGEREKEVEREVEREREKESERGRGRKKKSSSPPLGPPITPSSILYASLMLQNRANVRKYMHTDYVLEFLYTPIGLIRDESL